MKSSCFCRILLAGMLVILLLPITVAAEGRWFVSLYGGEVGYGSLGDTLSGELEFKGSHHFIVGVLGKELWTWRDYIRLEVEGQAAQHWGDESHNEFNAVFVARWLPFWWDHIVDTSFAVGDGLSYATRTPAIEKEQHDETSKLLNYLMFELDFTSPRPSPWSVFFRLHHRSGMDGLFNDVRGASNALAAGVKYAF
ncbi:MAG: hypothetical protein GX751_00160 [Desulfuromonadaceae bacterium]|nr:hypothetical protein [Desulfuromonadaceae bacterium]